MKDDIKQLLTRLQINGVKIDLEENTLWISNLYKVSLADIDYIRLNFKEIISYIDMNRRDIL